MTVSVSIILLGLGLICVSINCVLLTRQLARLARRVVDLEYPLQAKAKGRLKE